MIEAFDNSMLSNLKRCPRYFFHRHIEHITPVAQTFDMDFKAQFGVAVHAAMDEWFDHGEKDKMNKAFIDIWMPFEGVDPIQLRTLARGIDLLERYRTRYPLENEPFEVVHIEVGFACELGRYIYCGRIDKVVRWKLGMTGLVAMDHKTSSSKGYLTPKPNAALDGYIWDRWWVNTVPTDLQYVFYHDKKKANVQWLDGHVSALSYDELNKTQNWY